MSKGEAMDITEVLRAVNTWAPHLTMATGDILSGRSTKVRPGHIADVMEKELRTFGLNATMAHKSWDAIDYLRSIEEGDQ